MTDEQPILIEPTERLRDEYLAFVAEFGDDHVEGGGPAMREDEPFAQFLRRLADCAAGVHLPEGEAPASTYWLVRDGRILGTCNIRHELTESLRSYGGHIGYSVRPSERRKGYGTELLRLALDKARQLGLARALVTCEKRNVASARVIEANGGVLESEGLDAREGKRMKRYWIDLGRAQ